ncbi:MAG: hypothetical protein J4432_03050 [DPANN group archaeon]|nr:hypothetical protein [DPANN group archaeon]
MKEIKGIHGEPRPDFFNNYTKRLELTKDNLLRILNEVGNALAYRFLGANEDILYDIKTDRGEYIVADGKVSEKLDSTKFEIHLDKPSPQVEKVKANMDYHINGFKFAFLKNDFNALVHHYANFYANYLIFIEIKSQFEKMIDADDGEIEGKMLMHIVPSYYYGVYTDPVFSKFIESGSFKFDREEIITYRKEALSQDPLKYYFFRLLDFSVEYLDTYYILSTVMLYFLSKRNVPKNVFLNAVKESKFENREATDYFMSFTNYDNCAYFSLDNEDQKLTYYVNVGRMTGERFFSKELLVDNYPRYPFSMLLIQEELNIKG